MMTLASCASTHFMQRAAREVARVMEFSAGDKPRILFVEDEADCRQAFKCLFRHHLLEGFSVDFAEDVNEAMTLIVCNVYDLAILDYQLRGETAKELVTQWRDHGYHLPFLVVSGHTDVAEEMQRLGSSGFLEKGTASNPDMLARSINRALSAYWFARCQ